MKYLTKQEAAKHYGLSMRTLERRLAAGTIKKRSGIGRTVQIPVPAQPAPTRERRKN